MNTGKRSSRHIRRKKSTSGDDTTEAAGRSAVAVQTDPVDGNQHRQSEGPQHREETSAGDPHPGRVRAADQGHTSEPPSSSSRDADKQGAECERAPRDDIPTFMVPQRIVRNVYPVQYQGTVLYIPTGGFLRPHALLHQVRSEE